MNHPVRGLDQQAQPLIGHDPAEEEHQGRAVISPAPEAEAAGKTNVAVQDRMLDDVDAAGRRQAGGGEVRLQLFAVDDQGMRDPSQQADRRHRDPTALHVAEMVTDVVDGDNQGAAEERQREDEPGDAVSEKVDNVRLGPSNDLDDRGHEQQVAGIAVPRPAQRVEPHRRGQVGPVAGQHRLRQDEGNLRLGGECATMATAYSSGPVGRHGCGGACRDSWAEPGAGRGTATRAAGPPRGRGPLPGQQSRR